jgi:DNA-directed RNA polymerase subunit RPC12/RpoP
MKIDADQPENLQEYIALAKKFFELEKNRRNLRTATHLILDFYKLSLTKAGNAIGEKHCEDRSITNKFLSIKAHIPEFEEKADLIEEIEGTRNRIYHDDLWFDTQKLEYLLKEADSFLGFADFHVKIFSERGEKARTLKDKVKDAIFNLGFFISLNKDVGHSEELKEFIQKKAQFESADLKNPTDRNLEVLLGLLDIDIKRLRSMYDKAWETCPRCGGRIIHKTPSETHYSGPYDDQEPYAVTYHDIVECEKCGYKLVDEQETIDI